MDFKELVNETFMFQEKSITVIPYIDYATMVQIAVAFTSEYFYPALDNTVKGLSEWDLVGAEYVLVTRIVNECTNISVFDDNGKINMKKFDNIFRSGLWDEIRKRIKNYAEFRSMLYKIVDDIKEQMLSKKSVGSVIDNFSKTLQKSFSQEALKSLTESAEKLSETVKDSPMGKFYKEAGEYEGNRKT